MQTSKATAKTKQNADSFALDVFALYNFELSCNENLTNGEFVRYLNSEEIHTQRGKNWDKTGVRRSLTRGRRLNETHALPTMREAMDRLKQPREC